MSQLQDMVPALVDAIKSHGLALVVDKSGEPTEAAANNEKQLGIGGALGGLAGADPFPKLPKGVDGLLKSNGVLRFNEYIDV